MAQQLQSRAAACCEDPSFISGTHRGQLPTICSPSSRENLTVLASGCLYIYARVPPTLHILIKKKLRDHLLVVSEH